MRRRQSILECLDSGMDDCYTKRQLFNICANELSESAKRMDTALLKEALYAIDERSDEDVAPHRSYVWAVINKQIRVSGRKPRQKSMLMVAIIVMLLALAGGCLAWAIKASVISFPSIVFPQLQQVYNNDAQSLVQNDLFQARYDHCELRVREAVYDGHQLRIVYSLRDIREDTSLSEVDLTSSSIAAAQLDGIGGCDYLTIDGQDIYLDDTYQLPDYENDEMLYYLAANIPEEIKLQDVVIIKMPIGEIDIQAGKRVHEEVCFSLNTTTANAYSLSAETANVVWGDMNVEVVRAEFSPLHGLVQVRYSATDSSKQYIPQELHVFTEDGIPLGQKWYSSFGGKPLMVDEITTQYIPNAPWPEKMVLALEFPDGSMDYAHVIPLTWKPHN